MPSRKDGVSRGDMSIIKSKTYVESYVYPERVVQKTMRERTAAPPIDWIKKLFWLHAWISSRWCPTAYCTCRVQ